MWNHESKLTRQRWISKSSGFLMKMANFIPKFTDSIAQRLSLLRVSICHLKVVSKEDLQQFPHSTYPSLPNNDLEWLRQQVEVHRSKNAGFADKTQNSGRVKQDNESVSLTELQTVGFYCEQLSSDYRCQMSLDSWFYLSRWRSRWHSSVKNTRKNFSKRWTSNKNIRDRRQITLSTNTSTTPLNSEQTWKHSEDEK